MFSQIITQCLSQRSDNFVCPMKIASEWPGLLGCWSCYNSSLLVIFKFETTAPRVYGTFTLMDKKSVKRRTGSYDLAADRLSLQTQLNALKNTFDIEVPTHLIIDSLYDIDDYHEVTAFEDATEQLYDSLVKMSPAMTKAMLVQHDKLINGKF